jgi:hypothetical protein
MDKIIYPDIQNNYTHTNHIDLFSVILGDENYTKCIQKLSRKVKAIQRMEKLEKMRLERLN